MRYHEIISEGRDAPLYHSTSLLNAISILRNGFISKSPKNFGHLKGVSTTRDRLLKFGFNGYDTTEAGKGEIQFVVNQAAIANRFRINPFSFYGSKSASIPDWDKYRREESEEIIDADISITSEYISKIIIEPTLNDEHEILELISLARSKGIEIDDQRKNNLTESASLNSDLLSLMSVAKTSGVLLRCTERNSKVIDLDFIQREDNSLKGSGAKIMLLLCKLADDHRARIDTYVYGADPTLTQYYKNLVSKKIKPRMMKHICTACLQIDLKKGSEIDQSLSYN